MVPTGRGDGYHRASETGMAPGEAGGRGEALTVLAAIIGSLVDTDGLEWPGWMMDQVAEYLYANEGEMVIQMGQRTLSPAILVEQFRMRHSLHDIAEHPWLLLSDEEATLHGLRRKRLTLWRLLGRLGRLLG